MGVWGGGGGRGALRVSGSLLKGSASDFGASESYPQMHGLRFVFVALEGATSAKSTEPVTNEKPDLV